MIPKVSWGMAQFQRIAEKDINGNDVVNSAGIPFNPSVQLDDSRPVLQIVRNELTYDETLAGSFRDKVNDADFWGYGEKQVKVANISGSREWNQDIGYYWTVSYEFHIKAETWKFKILDAGTMQIKTGGDTKVSPCLTKDGKPVPEPVPLDGSGVQLAVGGTPTYLVFDLYDTADFSTLNFDSLYAQISNYTYTPPTT
jgi:hypothetical protein